jgi:hypothetical protein
MTPSDSQAPASTGDDETPDDSRKASRKPRDLQRTGLFLCDAEIARRLGVSDDKLRTIVKALEREGFPKRDVWMGGRYWRAVVAFFDRRYRIADGGSWPLPDGKNNLDAFS